MGAGPTKIDYKERDFTKQPLEYEEIDILLDALPEDSIIGSLDSEGREKILGAMSDQKLFNLKGDSIFDYYFANNKEDIKGCMTNQFTRDGTPCPDGKFNRMITRIPDLVQGPLREKVNLEALALDGFLANPEMYNKMLMEKMSEKALNIFTKDGDIDINVKELVEHSSIKSALDRSYKEKRTRMQGFIQGSKTQASYLINGFKKESADSVKSQMPPLAFLVPLIRMKIAAQYSGSDKTKIVPNRILYTTFPEFFDELGIGSNNIEYTLKFITFNTFKKFMDYDSKNDVKGIDLHLQDFLKLIKEFGGEEYLNSLSNFDVDTNFRSLYHDLQTKYDTLNTSKTNLQSQFDTLNTEKGDLESEIQKNLLSNVIRVTDGDNIKTVSEQQCKEYAKSLGTTMGKGNDTSGCYLAPHEGGGYGVYYNKKSGRGSCYYNNDSDYRKCIQNNLNRNNTYSKKNCKGNIGGEYDCRVDGTWDQITLKGWNRDKYGQTLNDAKHFCNTHKDCIAVAQSSTHWNWPVHTTSKFKPCNKYREVGSGSPDLSITKEDCKAHAKSIGRPFYHDSTHSHYALGCSRWLEGNDIYWSENPDASDKKCGHGGHHCIKKDICNPKMNYYTKRECKKPIDAVWTKGVGESCQWECPGRSGIEKYSVPKFQAKSGYGCPGGEYIYDKEKKAHSKSNRKLVQGSAGYFSCRTQSGANYGWKSYKHQDDRMTYKSSCSDWDNPEMFDKEVNND